MTDQNHLTPISPNDKRNKSNFVSSLLAIITSIILIIFAAWLFVKLTNYFSVKDNVNAPISDNPPNVNGQSLPVKNYNTLELINSPFTPSNDVYSNPDIYNASAAKLGLHGDFEEILMEVNGIVTDDKDKLVSVNVGTESGVLNAVRENVNTLDLDATDLKGGLFKNDIKFTIDFLGETSLATTRSEFQLTRQGTKIVKFWDYIIPSPPTVVRILIAPFDKNGIYGGAKIDSIKIKYICKVNSDCKAVVCQGDSLFTKCLKDNFGQEAAKQWCNITNMQGCENL